LEIAPFTLADSVTEIGAARRTELRNLAAEAGLAIAGIHWVLVKPEGMYLNHPDAHIRTRTADYFCDLVDFCGDLGGRVMVVGSPKQRSVLPGVDPQQAWDWAVQSFEPAVRRAEARGVVICIEPLAPAETNFINTAADAVQFTRALPSKSFRIILDVKAMVSESKPIEQIIRESAGEFAHFHANDPNLKGPGFGNLDFRPIATTLREVNYSGYVSVEVFDFAEGSEAIASRSIEYLKRAFD